MATVKTLAVIAWMGAWFGDSQLNQLWIVEQLHADGDGCTARLPATQIQRFSAIRCFAGVILKENQEQKAKQRVTRNDNWCLD